MSSNLTSVSINKNKSRFAPKVKSRPGIAKRPQASDAPTSSPSSSSSTVKSSLPSTESSDRTSTAAKASTDSIIQETVTVTSDILSTRTSTTETSSTTTTTTVKKSVSKRPKSSSASGTPITIGAPSTSSTTTKNSTAISQPTNGNKRPATKIDTPNTPSTPVPSVSGSSSKNDEQTTSDRSTPAILTKKQKLMKNIKDAMKKSDKTPSPISTPKPTSGHAFAAPSNTPSASSSSTTTATEPSTSTTTTITPRKRRVQMVQRDQADTNDDTDYVATTTTTESYELEDGSDNEVTDIMVNAAEAPANKKRKKATGKKKKEVLLAKDMKTLDDLTTDPLIAEDLDRDIKYFLKDLPRGVVTKQFRDEQIEREQEQLQREEEAAALKNDQHALDRLAEQRLALKQQKEKDEAAELAKKAKLEEEEAERQRKKQQQSGGLAESNHALQVRMVNGQIVLDTDSMMIDRDKDREEISHEHMEVVEENAQSRKVNFKTYGKNTGNKRWAPEETDLFYELLAQFGTDFEMISQMIPNRSRTQVRLKYNKEQKVNSEKVTEYMVRKKKPLDLETFKNVTGLEFEEVPDHFHTLQIV